MINRTLLAMVLMASSAAVSAADKPLDASAGRDHPTIRNEIRRGVKAELSCMNILDRHFYGDPGALAHDKLAITRWQADVAKDRLEYIRCVTGLIPEAARNDHYSIAFEIGIEFSELLEISTNIMFLEKYPPYRTEVAKELEKDVRRSFDRLTKLAAALDITINEVCEAAFPEAPPEKGCEKSIMPLLNKQANVSN